MKLFNLTLCMLFALTFFGQGDPNKRMERFESRKIAYITEKLDLSPQESEKFWPIYREYRKELEQIKKNSDTQNIDSMSESEAQSALKNMVRAKRASLDLEERYIDRMRDAIPSSKILQLFSLEKDFRKRMLEGMKNRRMKGKMKERMKNRKERINEGDQE